MSVSIDVRQGGQWGALQRTKNDALWALASLALAGSRPLPVSVLRMLGRTLGTVAYLLLPKATRTAHDNMARVFPALEPHARTALVRRCYRTLGELLGETVAMLRPGPLPSAIPLSPEGAEVLASARAEGRGVVFASAHLGPWEHVAVSLVAAGFPLVALGREGYDPRFSRIYERLRQDRGVRIIWRSRPGAAASILRTLRRGDILGIPMDLRSRVPSCDVPFLGHPAATPIGPARIALRARAPVVVGTAAPGPSGLVVTVTPVSSSDLSRDDAGARILTARINAELSRRILALPHGWVWMHDRWRS